MWSLGFFDRRIRWAAVVAIGMVLAGNASVSVAQVPIPIQEQVQLFNSLPPAQQQALIRELQRSLPPAQRQAIVSMLQGQGSATTQAEGATTGAPAPTESNLTVPPNDLIPRFQPRDTVVLEFKLAGPPPAGATPTAPSDFLERLARGNPYQLDAEGRLLLPGVAPIALAGLTVDEATVRVKSDPVLRIFDAVLTRLPLDATGTAALKPFGYDLFTHVPSTFAPVNDIPVPADYVLGPGDTVNVQLFGNQNNEYFLPVSRDGTINFPEIGPINVTGLTFPELKTTIDDRVGRQMIGVRASVTLGDLRTIRVFVLGDAVRPGSYVVSGLSTITNALFASGGVTPVGSLRNIVLMRGGATVSTLDLYQLLLRGDTSADVRLQPGDAIFIPPVGPRVSVGGEVRRPAIYEVKGERAATDLLALAGGLNATANRTTVKIERVVPNAGTTVQDVDLLASGGQTPVRDGDIIRVQPNLSQLESSVRLEGNVFQPGLFQWSSGMRIADLIPSSERVRPLSDLNYVLIRRESAPNVSVQVLSVDLRDAWRTPAGPNNVRLESRDTVYVFNLDAGRDQYIQPIIKELEAQAPPNSPSPVVRVGGQVRIPGEYPLEQSMHVSDLLRAGGGLSEAAYLAEAELTRYAIMDGEYREVEIVHVDLAAALRGDPTANLALTAHDYLNVKEVSRWRAAETVTLRGEVVFPGTYPIRRGELLSTVLMRAGGLTDLAFPSGSVFTRTDLRDREREQLEVLASRIERDIATLSLSEQNSAAVSTGQSLVTQLRSAVATGRLVIHLGDVVKGLASADVVLRDGDQLIVPEQRQEVTVLGEVQYATSHLYESDLRRDDYIAKSGGLTQRADKRRIYVVRANGEVIANSGGSWFSRGGATGVGPGDTIVVPLKIDQPLARWASVTQIIYNLAVAAAAVASF